MALDLAEFMETVGARVTDVARESGVDKAIVSRIKDRAQDPTGATLLKLTRWADSVARRKRLPRTKHLSFDYLLDGDAA
jgi:hypothetical protein